MNSYCACTEMESIISQRLTREIMLLKNNADDEEEEEETLFVNGIVTVGAV